MAGPADGVIAAAVLVRFAAAVFVALTTAAVEVVFAATAVFVILIIEAVAATDVFVILTTEAVAVRFAPAVPVRFAAMVPVRFAAPVAVAANVTGVAEFICFGVPLIGFGVVPPSRPFLTLPLLVCQLESLSPSK